MSLCKVNLGYQKLKRITRFYSHKCHLDFITSDKPDSGHFYIITAFCIHLVPLCLNMLFYVTEKTKVIKLQKYGKWQIKNMRIFENWSQVQLSDIVKLNLILGRM